MSDDQAIREAQAEFWQACNRGDAAVLTELIDADFVYVEADSLERRDREAFIAEVADRSDGLKVVAFEFADVRIQQAGDMAVAYSHFHIEHDDGGERYLTSGNAIEVLIRRDGRWRIAGSVFGEIPPFVE